MPRSDSVSIRRLHRKLEVRRAQRAHGRTEWTLEQGAKPVAANGKAGMTDLERDGEHHLYFGFLIVSGTLETQV